MNNIKRIKVMIVDDHPIVRYGISRIVNSQPDMTVCGEAHSLHTTMQGVEKNRPDVILLDISLKDVDGLKITKNLRTRGCAMPILIVSMHDESIYAQKALRAGANGYLTKDESSEKLVTGIKEVYKGGFFVSDKVRENLIYSFAGSSGPGGIGGTQIIDKLSDRERQIFIMIGRGYTTRKIAENLSISPKTIDSHRARIKLKLDIDDGQKLMLAAVDWVTREGLVPAQI